MKTQAIFEIDSSFDRSAELANPEVLERIEGREHRFRSTEPLRCLIRKKSFADMIWTYPTHCFISERLLGLFRDASLTGFETRKANMKLAFPHEPADRVFHQLIWTGWGGVADPRSGIVQIPSDQSQHAYLPPTDNSRIFDDAQWDGSDFFFIFPLMGSRFATERVIRLLEQFKINYYTSTPIVNFPRYTTEIFPAPLRCYYSDEKAKELGKNLGIDWWEIQKHDA